jgi:hypothetical protein
MKLIYSNVCLFLLVSLFQWGSSNVYAQCNSPVIFNSPGEFDFFVPAGVNSLEIEVWGAGAGGGGRTTNGTGGGGGGGAYSRSEITVIPGTVYTVSVGAGGLSNINGEDSWIAMSDAISNKVVLAKGGESPGPNNTNGGLGGSSANGIGTFRFSGGDGATAAGNAGGGGGSSAGIGVDGNSATGRDGAAEPTGGGPGGNGANGNNDGSPASEGLGGGGGGARGTNQAGGNGGNGRVRITYTCQVFVGGTLLDDGAITGTTIIEFASSGINKWTAPKGLVEFELFVVGGGGGGGFGNAAGGGGGGGITIAGFNNINGGQGFEVDTEFEMNVGGGGGGAGNQNIKGTNGTLSLFGQGTGFQIVAGGGGGGGSDISVNGNNGFQLNASGGGASGLNTPGNGRENGNGGSAGFNNSIGGGGGGAGGPGTSGIIIDGPGANFTANGGNGGDGFSSGFRGNVRIYASGGGGTTNGGSSAGSQRNVAGLGGSGVGNNANNTGTGGAPLSSPGSGGGAGSAGGGAGSSGVVIIRYPNFRILPVEYLYFDANFSRETKSVDLKWATAKERENSHFEIQRSLQDVKNWQAIDIETGVGWSDDPVEYVYNDDNLPLIGGLAYYRLLQVDFNGKSNFSKTIAVRIPALNQVKGVWRAYPNPNTGVQFNLELIDERKYNGEDLRVRLITPYAINRVISGTDLHQISRSILEELQKASNGIYILEISWGQKIEVLKIMKN